MAIPLTTAPSRYYTYSGQVPPGQTVKFTAGKGYYGVTPAAPSIAQRTPGIQAAPAAVGGVAPPPSFAPQSVAAPTDTGGSFGLGTVDWSNLIGGSWEVGQAEAMQAQQMAQARQAFQTDLRAGLVNLGLGDKTQLGDFSQYIDKATLKNAIANKYSQYAQTADQQARAQAQNNAQLAARGMLASGQTAKSAADLTSQVEQSHYDALQNFLQSGTSGLRQMTSLSNQLAQGVASARFAAAQRLAQQQAMAQQSALMQQQLQAQQLQAQQAQAPQVTPAAAGAPYDPYTDPTFPGGPAGPPLVGTNSAAWLNWLQEHG